MVMHTTRTNLNRLAHREREIERGKSLTCWRLMKLIITITIIIAFCLVPLEGTRWRGKSKSELVARRPGSYR